MNMNISTALGLSLLGILIVFVVLIILMGVIHIMTAIMKKADKKAVPAGAGAAAAAPAPASVAAPAADAPLAKGSCGEVSMTTVPDREAALIMAVTADELGVPLNELRFISIKEVEEESK